MATIQDFINQNEGQTMILLSKMASKDPWEPLQEDLWEGKLEDIPSEYRELEVLHEGWLIGREINQLSVYIEQVKDYSSTRLFAELDDEVQKLCGKNHDEWARMDKKKYLEILREISARMKY